eukprot:7179924-Prorocentrum_lima.AAC.1
MGWSHELLKQLCSHANLVSWWRRLMIAVSLLDVDDLPARLIASTRIVPLRKTSAGGVRLLSLIHISEPTRLDVI